jgi:MinD-like ATPase involved in chromosome partitioning or flagellar assembly
MGPEQAVSDHYEVLLIDDVCSFLTPRLVRSLRDLGREVVGVYSPADAPDAKRHLLECGITDVIECDASAEEFVAAATGTLLHRRSPPTPALRTSRAFRLGVVGASGGVGVTEVAIGVASGLSRHRPTLLVDLDLDSPSVAHRLDLPLHPNLISAIDAAHHNGRVGESIIESDDLAIIGGLAHPRSHDLALFEIDGLLDEAGASGYEVIVADLGAARADRLDGLRLDALIMVGLASPVGLSRLVRMVKGLPAVYTDTVVVVNRCAAGRRRLEIRSELARLVPAVPVVLLPEDRRLERAAWDGTRMRRGPFDRSVGRIATLIDGVTS